MEHLPWIVAISVALFIASAGAITLFLVSIPADYFADPASRHPPPTRHLALRVAGRVLKNLLGAVLFLLGFVMIFTPGQGLLTMVLGLSLVDFPGKHAVERWIISRPTIRHGANALRARWNKPPLVVPAEPFAPPRRQGALR